MLEATPHPAAKRPGAIGAAFEFSLVGHYRPGVERQVTTVLNRLGVDVETLDLRLSPEPHSGVTLFFVEARLLLPAGLRPGEVQVCLEDISPEVMVDISARPRSVVDQFRANPRRPSGAWASLAA